MTEENIFKLLKDNKELSSLPQVLAEIIRVTEREECSANDIAEVILKDPALSARMLRIVNSSFYGQTREITTINQSVVTLGIRAVKALALSAGLYRLFDNEDALVDRIRFWRHSLEVAIACREIADACGVSKSTVSLAINKPHKISKEQKEKVLKVAQEMGYFKSQSTQECCRRAGGDTGQAGA